MRKTVIFGAIGAFSILSACVSPAAFESAPVQVQTAQGVVTCQLYTIDMVEWDRSVARPEGMTVEQADQICINKGYEVAQAGRF